MSEFDPAAYFKSRTGDLSNIKTKSITAAMDEKLGKLREYQNAVAAGRAFQEPDRSAGDVIGDAAITALNGAIAVPEAFVGLADIATGGQVGKFLENEDGIIGFRPGETKEMLAEGLSDAQKEANLRVQLADGFKDTLRAALENPSTIATTVGEAVPSMLGGAAAARGLLGIGAKTVAGAAGGVGPALPGVLARAVGTGVAPVVAGAVGEGAVAAGSAAAQIRGETEDGLLTGKQALSALGSGAVGGLLGFAGGKLSQMLKLPDVDTMLASGQLKSPAGFVKAVAGAGITEGAFEEMPQSAQEQMWQNFALDKPLLEGVGDASAMGLLAGVAMGGTGGAVGGLAGMGSAPKAKDDKEPTPEQSKAQEDAITSGDVSALTDPKNPLYAPDKAIAALFGNSQGEAVTPEVRQANLEKADKIIADLDNRKAELEAAYQEATGESAKTNQQNLERYQALLAQTDPADVQRVEALKAGIEMVQEQLASPPDVDAKKASALEAQIKKVSGLIEESTKNRAQLEMLVMSETTLNDQVALADAAPVSTGDAKADAAAVQKTQAAVARVLAMAVASPERLDAQTAAKLAENAGNSLTPEQRSFLRAFSAARVAQNKLRDMDKTSQEIYEGSSQNVGIKQYRQRIAQALTSGNVSRATNQLRMLESFAADHADKAKVANAALKLGLGTQIVRTKAGWAVSDVELSRKELSNNGGLELNTARLVKAIETEAQALDLSVQEMRAAIGLKSGGANVKNAPQQGRGTQTEQKGADVPGAGQAGAAKAPADPGSAATTRRATAVVEPAGLSSTDNSESTQEPIGSTVTSDVSADVQNSTVDELTEISVDNQFTENTTEAVEPRADELAESLDEDVPVQEPVQADSATQAGGLEVLSTRSPEGTAFQQRNLIADFFVQSAGQDTAKTKRPLVAVKNFLSQLKQAPETVLQFLSAGELTPAQDSLLRLFAQKAGEWDKSIRANLLNRNAPDFRYQDLMQFFLQDTPNGLDLEENMKTAMSVAVFNYVAMAGSRSPFNTPEEMNAILDRDEDAPLSDAEQRALLNIGTRQNVVVNSLGQSVVQALGLKMRKDAPVEMQAKLESVLGAHVMKLMLDLGILSRKEVSGKEMAALTKSKGTDENAKFQFLSMARNEAGELHADAQMILERVKNTQGLLDKLFGVEAGLKEPSFEPIPFTQRKAKNSDQNVPEKLARVIEHENAVASYVRDDMYKLAGMLSEDIMIQVAGAVSAGDDTAHKVNRLKNQAKNDGLKRERQRFLDFVGNMFTGGVPDIAKPLYFDHVVWKQQRVGIATNAINPQTSKMHRHMLYRKSWETRVSRNDPAQMENFRLRVAEGLGIKTDKQSKESALAAFDAKVANPKIQAAVLVLRKSFNQDSLSEQDQETLLAGVQEGGEDMHSLDALMALAHHDEAGNGDFTVQMVGEVDGVTNGPMLSHLLLGAADSADELMKVLNRGGFYSQEDGASQYNQWRSEQGHLDLYEATSLGMVQGLQRLLAINPKLGEVMDAIYAFTGRLETDGAVTSKGRNIIKTPLTAMVFGSSVPTAVDNMADKFIEAIYAKIEEVAVKGEDPAYIGSQINALLRQAKVNDLVPRMSIGDLMDYELNARQVDGLKKVFKDTLGESVKETLSTEFASFIERRKTLNQTAQMTHALYNAAYTTMREELIEQLMEAESKEPGTGIAFAVTKDGKRIPRHDLTAQQDAELRKKLSALAPVMHTALSKESGSLAAGLRIAKGNRKLSQSPTHESTVRFGSPIPGSKATSTAVRGYFREEVSPGVAMLPMSAHSADSAIMHGSIGDTEVLNVHDAKGVGLGGFQQAAQSLNQSTWKVMLDYSPAQEMLNAMARTMNGLASLAEQGDLSPAAAKKLAEVIKKYAKDTEMEAEVVLDELAANAQYLASKADQVKFEAMSQMVAIDQYALEGGNYVVTDADRAEAAKRLAAVPMEMPQSLKDSVAKLKEFLRTEVVGSSAASQATAEANTENDLAIKDAPVLNVSIAQAAQLLEQTVIDRTLPEQVRNNIDLVLETLLKGGKTLKQAVVESLNGLDAADVVQALGARMDKVKASFWGKLGQSAVEHDAELVAFFENNPRPKAEAVIKKLYDHIGKMPKTAARDFNLELLKQLYVTVPKDLPVQYITPTTPESLVDFKPPTSARGFYASNGSGVFILSPDFVVSGVRSEVVIHELVHAALHHAINNPDAATRELVDELEKLRTKAIEFAQSKGILEKHLRSLVDLDEFLAWGLTNREFQRDVLSQISMQSKTRKNVMATAMQEFVNTVTAILFRGSKKSSQEIAANGVSVLINNASGLFQTVVDNAAIQTGEFKVLSMEADPVGTLNTYSTLDLHAALNDGNLDSAFQEHLGGLLTRLVEKLHGPFGSLKARYMDKQALSPLDVWLKAMDLGDAPFASKVTVAPFQVSQQEAFAIEQVEATVRAALQGSETHTKMVYRELTALYQEAYQKLKANNPDTAPGAAERFDFIFALDKTNGDQMDHLARFAAMGLAHKGFHDTLASMTSGKGTQANKPQTIAEKVQALFERMLEVFQKAVTRTYNGQPMDAKLDTLVSQLVDIEAKRRHQLAAAASRTNYLAPVEKGARDAFTAVREKASDLAGSEMVRKSKSALVRATGTVVRTVVDDRLDTFLAHLGELRDREFKDRPGVVAGIFNSVRGPKAVYEELLRFAKGHERDRKAIIASHSKAVLNAFANNGAKLNKQAKAAISAVFIRTGAHALHGHFTNAQIEGMVSDDAQRNQAIAALEAKLNLPAAVKAYAINQANYLAYYKATGINRSQMLMMNAHNILRLYGTKYRAKTSAENMSTAQETLEQLIALYAIGYTDKAVLNRASEVLRSENQRGGENGVEFVLRVHKTLEQESKDRLFQGKEALAMHGYASEIYNPYAEVLTATEDEGKELEAQGYVKGSAVPVDPSDPDQSPRYIYKRRGAGLQPYLTGAMSYTGTKAKGRRQHDGVLNVNAPQGAMNASLQSTITNDPGRQQAIAGMFKTGPRQDLSKVKGSFMAPVLNAQGDLVNWRYLMSERTKDELLERDNRFEVVMGTMAGSIYDKATTPEQNATVVGALKEQYDAEFARQSHSYIEVGAESPDAELREVWALLPDETKAEVRKVWGRDSMMVRKDSLDMVFGYRKLSLADVFKKSAKDRNALEKAFVAVAEEALVLYARASLGKSAQDAEQYAKRAMFVVTKGERMWQELVREAKDILVVKSGVVLLGNIWSNFSMLWLSGVSIKDMMHHQLVALKGATAYRQDSEQLAQLRLELESGYTLGNEAEIRRQIALLEDSLARNPVRELIDAGLMPTIVEDVVADDDIYSYKSDLVRKTDGLLKRLNPTVVEVGRQVYMAHDTKMYQALSRATQLSDFVARYALYQHLVSRQENPLSKADAVQEASDAFVNYDIPLHRGLQFTDDMGLTMFTKYFLYIQRALQKTMRDNPARVMTMAALANFVGLGPIVLNSMAITRIGNNPLESGAFKLVESLDDLATVNSAMALIK